MLSPFKPSSLFPMRLTIFLPLLLAPFLAATALFSVVNIEWHDQQRLAQCLLLGVALAALSWAPAALTAAFLRLGASRWVLLAFFGLGLLAVSAAEHPLWAWLEWSLFAALCLLLLAMADASLREPAFAAHAAAWGIGGYLLVYQLKTLAALAAVYQGVVALDTVSLLDGFSNRRALGQMLTLAWPLLLTFSACADRPRDRRLLWLAASASVYVALITQTRGTLWGLLLAVAALPFVVRPGRRWWRFLFTSLGAGAFVYFLLIFAPSQIFGWLGIELHLKDGSLSGREVLWAASVEQIKAQPWLGMGPMGFAALHIGLGAHPHNIALQIAAEWGVPAAFLLGGLMLLGLWRFACMLRMQPPDAPQTLIGAGLFLALTASLVQSLVDGVFVMPISQLLLVAVAAGCLAWCQLQAGPVPEPVRSDQSLWVTRAVVLAVWMSLAAALWMTSTLRANGLTQREHCHANTPRFWACGVIAPR